MYLCFTIFSLRRLKLSQTQSSKTKHILKNTLPAKTHQTGQILRSSNSNRTQTVEQFLMKRIQSASKTKKTKDLSGITNKGDIAGSSETPTKCKVSSLTVPVVTKHKHFCESRVLSSRQEEEKELFELTKKIPRLSSGKRRVLVGITLPAVNEKNYLACPSMASSPRRRNIKVR